MATYTVWEHDRFGEDKAARAVFVRDGFSWLAFLFAPFWLLANKMFVVFLALAVAVTGVIAATGYAIGDDNTGLVALILALWFGFEANNLRRWSLARRGYRLAAMVEADRRLAAEARYYSEREDGVVAAAPAGPRGEAMTGIVGLFPEPER